MKMHRSVVVAVSATLVISATLAAQNPPPGNAPGAAQAPEKEDPRIRGGTALAALVAEVRQNVVYQEVRQNATAAKALATKAAAAAKAEAGEEIEVDIPLWLQAHYLRNHPELRPQAKAAAGVAAAPTAVEVPDPTGGFPLALESLYTWMLLHQNLEPPPAAAASAADSVVVGKNVKISGKAATPRSESEIRIDPANPARIIGASNNLGNGRQAQFFSADGGATWGQTTLPLQPGDSAHTDPTLGWTTDGTAWATTIGMNAGVTVLQMRAYKSTDGGKTWSFDATFSGDQTSADKQFMCVDRSPTSTFRDQIYVIWHNRNIAFVNRRQSSGWGIPKRVSGKETTGTPIGSDIATNGKGEVFAVWPDTGSRRLFFIKSTDGGDNYTAPKEIAQTFGRFEIRIPSFAERKALIGVSIAAFDGAGRNDVYVSWIDLAGGAGCDSSARDPRSNVNSPCRSRVWFRRSIDGGATWEAPRKLNDGVGLADQFNQRLALDPETGNLGIIYHNTGTGQNRRKSHVVFQLSTDRGATWSTPAIQVTDAMTDETTVDADLGNQYGDYNGLSAAKGAFFPSWTDRRDNGSESIFTAKIAVKKAANGTLVPELVAGAAPQPVGAGSSP